MPVKIRLMRIGSRKRPYFRVVAVDERRKRTGGYIELLGTYNPLSTPKEIKLKQDRIDAWVKDGAQLSDGFLRIIGKAPQRPARKPKKVRPETAPAATPAPATKPEEQEPTPDANKAPVEETPAESTESIEAPIESETSLNEAPEAESAKEAAEVFEETPSTDVSAEKEPTKESPVEEKA